MVGCRTSASHSHHRVCHLVHKFEGGGKLEMHTSMAVRAHTCVHAANVLPRIVGTLLAALSIPLALAGSQNTTQRTMAAHGLSSPTSSTWAAWCGRSIDTTAWCDEHIAPHTEQRCSSNLGTSVVPAASVCPHACGLCNGTTNHTMTEAVGGASDQQDSQVSAPLPVACASVHFTSNSLDDDDQNTAVKVRLRA